MENHSGPLTVNCLVSYLLIIKKLSSRSSLIRVQFVMILAKIIYFVPRFRIRKREVVFVKFKAIRFDEL